MLNALSINFPYNEAFVISARIFLNSISFLYRVHFLATDFHLDNFIQENKNNVLWMWRNTTVGLWVRETENYTTEHREALHRKCSKCNRSKQDHDSMITTSKNDYTITWARRNTIGRTDGTFSNNVDSQSEGRCSKVATRFRNDAHTRLLREVVI